MNTIPPKAYTVSEIDELRAACRDRVLWGTTKRFIGTRSSGPYSSRSELESTIESRLRTHMIAGHVARDLYAADDPERYAAESPAAP